MSAKITRVSSKRPQGFRHAILVHNLRTYAPGGLIIVWLLASLVWFLVLKPHWESQDLQGIPYRSGVGTIANTMSVAPRYMDNVNVFVKVNGTTLSAKADMPVRAGQKVLVTYRIGKSGAIYVENISPLLMPQKTPE